MPSIYFFKGWDDLKWACLPAMGPMYSYTAELRTGLIGVLLWYQWELLYSFPLKNIRLGLSSNFFIIIHAMKNMAVENDVEFDFIIDYFREIFPLWIVNGKCKINYVLFLPPPKLMYINVYMNKHFIFTKSNNNFHEYL